MTTGWRHAVYAALWLIFLTSVYGVLYLSPGAIIRRTSPFHHYAPSHMREAAQQKGVRII